MTRAQGAYRLLNTLGTWLPILALVLLAIGVYVAKSHRRALLAAGLGVAGGMLLLGVTLAVVRPLYLNAVPPQVPHDAAATIYDTLLRFLRVSLRAVLVAGLVVAAAAFLTGGSVTAVRTRQGLTHGIGWLRGGAESAGLRTGAVGTWVYAHKKLLRVLVVVAAALALTFWTQPTAGVVLLLAAAGPALPGHRGVPRAAARSHGRRRSRSAGQPRLTPGTAAPVPGSGGPRSRFLSSGVSAASATPRMPSRSTPLSVSACSTSASRRPGRLRKRTQRHRDIDTATSDSAACTAGPISPSTSTSARPWPRCTSDTSRPRADSRVTTVASSDRVPRAQDRPRLDRPDP